MSKEILAAVLAALTLGLTPDQADAPTVEDVGYPPCAESLAEPTDGNCQAYEQAVRFSELPDDVRFDQQDDLPGAPAGWLWAEDLTLVPTSYYEGAQGAAPSSLSSDEIDSRIVEVEDRLIACGQDQLASSINDAYSWTAGDPEGASPFALELMAEGAERVAERGCA